jgi:hypothetical protein
VLLLAPLLEPRIWNVFYLYFPWINYNNNKNLTKRLRLLGQMNRPRIDCARDRTAASYERGLNTRKQFKEKYVWTLIQLRPSPTKTKLFADSEAKSMIKNGGFFRLHTQGTVTSSNKHEIEAKKAWSRWGSPLWTGSKDSSWKLLYTYRYIYRQDSFLE